MRHVVQRRVQPGIGEFQRRLMLLAGRDIVTDRHETALPGVAAIDAQPTSVGKAGFPGVIRGSQQCGHRRHTVRSRRRSGIPGRHTAEHPEVFVHPGIGHGHDAGGIDDHHALARPLDGVGQAGLGRSALCHLTRHHRRDVVPHRCHGRQQRAQFVRACGRNMRVELTGRDPARDRRSGGDRPDNASSEQNGDQTAQCDRQSGSEQRQRLGLRQFRPRTLAKPETVPGDGVDQQFQPLVHNAG